MPASSTPPRIFISAAEPSADLHGAALIRAVQDLCSDAHFTGVAGPLMQQAGCKSIYDMSQHSSMLVGAFGHVHHGYRMLSLVRRELALGQFHAAVVIDAPILNLRVAKRAKSFGLLVLYYIAPQLWAWAENLRISRVRSTVDRIACILPFEEPYYRAFGVEASYVGHPLFATLGAKETDADAVRQLGGADQPILAIMPGSRRHVVGENFPGQLRVAEQLRARFPKLRILVSVANDLVRPILEEVSHGIDVPVQFHAGGNAELLAAADLALISSGTATLEAAYHNTPMIVMYNSSRVLYQWLFRFIITTKYFSLPNILAGREVVPEFMPFYRSIDPIVERAAALLADSAARERMSADLAELVRPFLETTASETTAKILLDLIETHAGRATALEQCSPV
jgi:lipid-A-disaccharide synthase